MDAEMQNVISNPLCYGGIIGTSAVIVFVVYLFLRFGWILACFLRAAPVHGVIVHLDVNRRKDLPQGDQKNLPEYLTYSAINIVVEYEWKGRKYKTRCVSYWDWVGMNNVSGKLLQDLYKKYQSESAVEVFVDPRFPDRAVVYRSVAGVALVEVVILLIALAVLPAGTYKCAQALAIENIAVATVVGILAGLGGILDSVIKVRRRLYD